MNKYAIAALLFLFNNEVLSWIALVIIAALLLGNFTKEVFKEL